MNEMYAEVIEDITLLDYDFRINDLDEALEVQFEGQWQRMTDNIEAIIELKMRMLGYGNRELKSANLTAMKQAWILRGHEQRYNPIKAYMADIQKRYKPETNGLSMEPYHVKLLADHMDNPDGMFEAFIHRWMVGVVAKVMEGARNPMLVLTGEQEVGKSWFSQWLCPIKEHFFRGAIKPDNKDERIRLSNVLVWEVDELGSTTRRADFEALKSFLTLNEVFERPSYGRYAIKKPAVTGFIGTVNPTGSGFLNDPTGSSRFLVTEINHINFTYSQNIKADDLWAEASWYYHHIPNSWKLSKEEDKQRRLINSQYETTSALLDLIEAEFDITGKQSNFMTSWQIKTIIEGQYRISNEQSFYNELGRVMRQLGCQKARKSHSEGGERGYSGIKQKDAVKAENEI